MARKRKRPANWKPQRVREDDLYKAVIAEDEDLVVIDQAIDWEPFQLMLEPLYHDTLGRPISNHAIEMLKANLIKFKYGWSDLETRHHIQHNLLFRNFLGLGPRDAIFEKTALSDFRLKLERAGIKKKIFFAVNVQLMELGLIESGETIFGDGTLIQASRSELTLTQLLHESIGLLLQSVKEIHPKIYAELGEKYGDYFDHYLCDGREPTIMFIDPESRTRNIERLTIDSHELFYFFADRDLDNIAARYLDFLLHNIQQQVVVEDLRDPSRDDDEKSKRVRKYLKKENFRLNETETGVQIRNNAEMEGTRYVTPHDLDATWGRGSGGNTCAGYRMLGFCNAGGIFLNWYNQTAGEREVDPPRLILLLLEMWHGFGFFSPELVYDMAAGDQETIDYVWREFGTRIIAKPLLWKVDLDGMFEVDRDNMVVTCKLGRVTSLKVISDCERLQADFPIDGCIWCPYWHECGGEPLVTKRKVLFPRSKALADQIEKMLDLDSREHKLLKERGYRIESRFGELKGVLGMRATRHVGLEHVDTQECFSLMVMNLKKIPEHLRRRETRAARAVDANGGGRDQASPRHRARRSRKTAFEGHSGMVRGASLALAGI